MLTSRQEKILKLIVEHYIKLAKPISSKSICKRLKCSSATIRNEMVHLEEAQLLEKTHTSSGRIPSEEGYRYYVDHLMEPKKMSGEDMLKLQIVFHNKQLPLADCINQSLQLISDMTNYATIVLGASSHDNLLKKIEVVPISDESIVILIVTNKGHVEHKEIKLEQVSHEDIQKTVSLINNLIVGTPIDEVSTKLEYEVKPIIGKYVTQHEQLYNAFYHAFSDFTTKDVNIAGRNKFLEQPEFNNVAKIKDIFEKLDDEKILREIEDDDDGNIKVYIGNENHIDSDVTVIKTKFKNNEEENTLAIIGPKRMDYEKVVSLLEFLKSQIEEVKK